MSLFDVEQLVSQVGGVEESCIRREYLRLSLYFKSWKYLILQIHFNFPVTNVHKHLTSLLFQTKGRLVPNRHTIII